MERIDSHQHFWVYDPPQYGWITPDKSILRRNFLPADLKPILAANRVSGTIAVQARQCLEETEWLLGLAEEHSFIKGVVGWVDLCSPSVPRQLATFTRSKKMVGVRHVLHDESDDSFMLRPDFRRGIAQLADFGLTYDLLIFPRHLAAATQLVAEFPNQSFILDHIAKPAIKRRPEKAWQKGINAIASFPNVACKISGLVTEAKWGAWRREDFRPYLDVVVSAFGYDRLMIGSDWPVCTLSGNYSAVLDVVTDYLAGLPEAIQRGVWGTNCSALYNLGESR